MPSAIKKRNGTAAAKQVSTAPTLQGIKAFGKISKVNPISLGKSKLDGRSDSSLVPRNTAVDANTKKRKLLLGQELSVEETFKKARVLYAEAPGHEENVSRTSRTTDISSSSLPLSSTQPSKLRKERALRSTTTDTPTKGARTCLESFILRSPSPSSRSPSAHSHSTETPPSSPTTAQSSGPDLAAGEICELPDELQDLANLHSSFLTALSLHYAHHGSLTPADVRILRPSIERSWGKRRVLLEDIQRLLALQQAPAPNKHKSNLSQILCALSLSDYGSGKICIEISDNQTHGGLPRRLLDEETLNARFSKTLSQQWSLFTTTHSPTPDPKYFISTLPVAPIITCASLSKTAPLLAKGQLRLTDLKAGAVRAQQRSNAANNSTPSDGLSTGIATKAPTTSRSSNLLSRILAKQQHQSTLPAPPSAETRARNSALQRLQEIIPVLDILTASTARSLPGSHSAITSFSSSSDTETSVTPPKSQQTLTFTMPTLVQHLQMSLRNPISKDEAVRCVRVLAEVVPECVGVREIGKVVGVVVRGGGRVDGEEVRRRVNLALGRKTC